VTASFRFDPNAARAFANRIRIQQVLVNLIRNALEAIAESDRCELEVTTAALDDDTVVEIAVSDSGPGLDEAVLTRLFEPFSRPSKTAWGSGSRSAARS
jgi:two-component system sensor kinase FixL